MKTKRAAWLGMVVGASMMLAGVAVGQQRESAQSGVPSRSPVNDAEPLGDLDFPGGTIAEYVAAVERSFGSANAVLRPGSESIQVVPVKFVGVRRTDAIKALEGLSPWPSKVIQVVSIGSPAIMQVNAFESQSELRVWSLRGLIDGGTQVEDILSAVETAIGLVGGEPKIRYHKDTALLIIQGWTSHLDAANQVLNAIKDSQREKELAAKRAAESQQPRQGN